MPKIEIYRDAFEQIFQRTVESVKGHLPHIHPERKTSDPYGFGFLDYRTRQVDGIEYRGPYVLYGLLLDGRFPVGFKAYNGNERLSSSPALAAGWSVYAPTEPLAIYDILKPNDKQAVELAELLMNELGIAYKALENIAQHPETANLYVQEVLRYAEPHVQNYKKAVITDRKENKEYIQRVRRAIQDMLFTAEE